MIKKLSLLFAAIAICGLNNVRASEIPAHVVKESNYNHHLKSRHGAVGVYQLMPNTAKKLGVNPYYLNENIKGGLTYYKMMYEMFGSTELALAAYNAGPGNVKKYNAIPPFTETRYFVSKIMADYQALKNNPDPVITKILDEQKKALEVNNVPVSDISTATPLPELPKMDEIPEVREPAIEMKTL